MIPIYHIIEIWEKICSKSFLNIVTWYMTWWLVRNHHNFYFPCIEEKSFSLQRSYSSFPFWIILSLSPVLASQVSWYVAKCFVKWVNYLCNLLEACPSIIQLSCCILLLKSGKIAYPGVFFFPYWTSILQHMEYC